MPIKNLKDVIPVEYLKEALNSYPEVAMPANDFHLRNIRDVETMFGYPANYVRLSPITQYLLFLHYSSPLTNNCGDVDERGNYTLDSKHIEKEIINIFADKFGLGDNCWGYLTSGGSESNSCGITLAFSKHPNGVLYFAENAHYSIKKYAKLYPFVEIPTLEKDIMDYDYLFENILNNYKKNKSPANIVLTFGTTMYGRCDNIDKVVNFLKENNIPFYLHIDAAFFGGIPNNQKNAPTLRNARARGIDSICVSMHKYIGFPDVKSIFVSKEKPVGTNIDYIGQRDTTISGSRSFPAYALLNHIKEQLFMQKEDNYINNILYFEDLLKEKNIPFDRVDDGNIFVLDAPKEKVCKKFQLSCFKERGVDKVHVIIFPNHKKENIKLLRDSLL